MDNEKDLKVEGEYGVNQISSLEGTDAIRKRPGMYVGSSSQSGIDQLVYEVIDNSVDEHIAGFGDIINVTVHKDCSVEIADSGRGIPVGTHHQWKYEDGRPMDTLTGIVTKIHAGGKFSAQGYKCFAEGSKVSNKNTTTPIEQIKINDKVTDCYGEEDKVNKVFKYEYDGKINTLTLENGKIIKAIDGHFILIQRAGNFLWCDIKDILPTDLLVELEENEDSEQLKQLLPRYEIVKY